MTARLYLNNQLADLNKAQDALPAVELSVYTAETLTSTQGSISYLIRLPKTTNNRKLLRFGDLSELADGGTAVGRIDAVLLDGEASIIRGRVVIEDSSGDTFDVRIISDDGGWIQRIADRNVRDLQLGTAIVGFPGQQVTDYWATTEADGLNIQFPLVSYGNFRGDPTNANISPLNGVLTIAESAGIIDGALVDNRNAYPFNTFDFRPAVYLRPVIRRILTEAGLNPGGSFFADARFSNILVPYVQEGGLPPASEQDVALVQATLDQLTDIQDLVVEGSVEGPYLDFTLILDPAPPDPLNPDQILGVDYWVDIDLSSLTVPVVITVSNEYTPPVPAPVSYTQSFSVWDGPTGFGSGNVGDLNTGTPVGVTPNGQYFILTPGLYRIQLRIDAVFVFGGAFGFSEAVFDINTTPLFDVSKQLPDINQVEFLAAVLKHFNLLLVVDDRTGNATVAPRTAYAGLPLNISDRAYAPFGTPVQQPRQIRLAYATEEGEAIVTNEQYDQRHVNAGGYHDGERVDESLFAATAMRDYLFLTQDVTVSLPTLNTIDEFAKKLGELGDGRQGFKYDYVPRLLRWQGVQSVAADDAIYIEDILGNVFTSGGAYTMEYPLASFPGPAVGGMTLAYNGTDGIYRNLFEGHLNRLARAQTCEVRVYLRPSDIDAIRRNYQVRIGTQVYFVQRVKYVVNEVSTLDLIKL